ncbi:MAG: GNAT family N-acetyltransferase [Microcoleaceae cyanobacterium]
MTDQQNNFVEYPYRIHSATTEAELTELYEQRWQVLRQPLGQARGTERDRHDDHPQTCHAIAIYKPSTPQQIVGSARLRQLSTELGSIAYLAVLPQFQRQGIGSGLVRYLTEIAQQRNCQRLRVMSRVTAIHFYQKLGFVPNAEPFDYLEIPHQFLYLNLLSERRL